MRDQSTRKARPQRDEGTDTGGWVQPPPATARIESGVPFKAELDLSELDERTRPGPTWPGKATELSRSHMVFLSRRMCYPGRKMVMAVHLVDAYPVPLFGEVSGCEYDGMGQYRTCLALVSMPVSDAIRAWLRTRQAKGTL